MNNEELSVAITADTTAFSDALDQLEKRASKFGDTLSGSLKSAISSGRSLEDVLRGLASSMASSLFDAGTQPLTSMLNNVGSSIFSSLGSVMPFAKGGLFQAGSVVSAPTYFPTAGKMGMMGEAGPEAIVPLTRGSDGRLGLNTGQATSAPTVNITIQTPDPAAFKQSETQITGALARAVMRGQRTN
ncbi:MAG: phage tail tape measure protein [Pseudomonadota bacterium]